MSDFNPVTHMIIHLLFRVADQQFTDVVSSHYRPSSLDYVVVERIVEKPKKVVRWE